MRHIPQRDWLFALVVRPGSHAFDSAVGDLKIATKKWKGSEIRAGAAEEKSTATTNQ